MAAILNDFTKPINELKGILEKIEFFPAINALLYFFIGIVITLIARWFVGKLTETKVSRHHSMLFRRLTFYVGLTLSLIFPLKASGIDVTALLGAAGILTAAVAFAAQTSISNFLSGVFLVAEKPFVIGDYVNVNDTIGEVLSIDLLSVKIRTKDNRLVRLPNESLLKSQFCNISRFPIRRCDIKIRVAFQEDLFKIKQILMETASKNPLCLVAPPPVFQFMEFGEAGLVIQLSVWSKQASFDELATSLQMEIQAALVAADIQPPTLQHPLAVATS